MKSWKEYEKKLFKNPAFRAEVNRLEPEYQLARQLIKARLEKKLTQAELARKAGTSQVVIARLESGTGNPTLGTIDRVAKVLGKEVKLTGTR